MSARQGRLLLGLLLLALPVLADDKPWEQPKDGVLTAKQVDAYVVYMEKIASLQKELSDEDAALRARKKERELADSIARLKKLEADTDAAKKATGFAERELEWVVKEVSEIYFMLRYMKDQDEQAEPRTKELDEKLATATKAKAEAEQQRKAGRKVMSPEDRAAARKDAEEEAKQAQQGLDDARTNLKEAKKALDASEAELKKAQGDAKAGCEQAVVEARTSFQTAKASELEAKAVLERAQRRIKDPDLPLTEEEKTALAQDLGDREKAAQADYEAATKERDEWLALVKRQRDQLQAQLKKSPPRNVALVQERQPRITAALESRANAK